jgi:hypothetical protein
MHAATLQWRCPVHNSREVSVIAAGALANAGKPSGWIDGFGRARPEDRLNFLVTADDPCAVPLTPCHWPGRGNGKAGIRQIGARRSIRGHGASFLKITANSSRTMRA